jgi:MYXO-CTERM domain-containing protein
VKTLAVLTGLAVIALATPAFAEEDGRCHFFCGHHKPSPGPELAIGISGSLAALGAFAATRIRRRR